MDLSEFVDRDSAGLLYETFPGIDWDNEQVTDSDFPVILDDLSDELNRLVENLISKTDWKYEYGVDGIEWELDAGTIIIDVTVHEERSRGDNYYVPDETFYNVELEGRVTYAKTEDVYKLAEYVTDYLESNLPF